MDREAWTHAVVSAAVVLDVVNDVCRHARVVLGGVAPIPWRLPEVEKILIGQRLTSDLAAKAAELAGTVAVEREEPGVEINLDPATVVGLRHHERGSVHFHS